MTSQERARDAIAFCLELARHTDVPHQTTRTFLSPATREVHRVLLDRMERTGMRVHVDHAGNLHGVNPGTSSTEAPFLIGSHIDTVPDAGAFDGVLGVVLGIALVESLKSQRLRFPIEIIAFSEEEGVRFGVPFIGSRGCIGTLDEALLQRPDASGITVAQAIHDFGLAPHPSPLDPRSRFLEIHIEQGPVLESLDVPLGIVEAIGGQTRMEFRFLGRANHAGTTPMHLRRDALAAAAEWICAVENDALATPGLVATVGKMDVLPGAANAIPGDVLCSLDLRHPGDTIRAAAELRITQAAYTIALRRSLSVHAQTRLQQPAVAMDPTLTDALQAAAASAGVRAPRMTSGAGHDAMILAQRIPTAMLFIRSPHGLSHHPDESVLPDDVAAALTVARRFLDRLASNE